MRSTLLTNYSKKRLFQGLACLILLVSGFILEQYSYFKPQEWVNQVESVLHKKESFLNKKLDELHAIIEANPDTNLFASTSLLNGVSFKENGMALMVYENDSLIFWSDNSPALDNYLKETCLDFPLAKLKNGYAVVIHHKSNTQSTKQLFGLIWLKNKFVYQNKFLVNSFRPEFQLPTDLDLLENISDPSLTVKNSLGETVFQLSVPNKSYFKNPFLWASVITYLAAFLFFLKFIGLNFLENLAGINKNVKVLLLILLLLSIRILLLINHLPSSLYETGLFDPMVFGDANSFTSPFLGDILINSFLLCYFTYLIFTRITFQLSNTVSSSILFILLLSLLFTFGIYINDVIKSLVTNSSISFKVNDLFSLDGYSFIGFLSIALLFLSFYFLSNKLLDVSQNICTNSRIKSASIFLVVFLLNYLYCKFIRKDVILECLWPGFIMLLIVFLKPNTNKSSIGNAVIFIFAFSFISSHSFLFYQTNKELESRKIYASNLSLQEDEIAENLFIDLSNKMLKDEKLRKMIRSASPSSSELEQRIRQVYFGGYWEKYNITFSVFDTLCRPLVKTTNPLYENNTYFDEQINLSGEKTICKDLYFIKNLRENTRYIGKISFPFSKTAFTKPAYFYAEIEPKTNVQIIGFPELLLEGSVKTNSKLNGYSYAVYRNNKLSQRYGKISYPFLFPYNLSENEYEIIEDKENQHLIYYSENQSIVIITKPSETFVDRFTSNSYFFMFFSIIVFGLLYYMDWRARKKHLPSSLTIRIQLLLVSIVLVSLIAFGFGSYFFVKRQFEAKSTELLSEKMKQVHSDLQNRMGEQPGLSPSLKEYTAIILQRLANVYLTDITLYDIEGNLYASSQPKLFDEGIVSKKINSFAFGDYFLKQPERENYKDKIGTLNYYSAYQPLFNMEGKLLCFINLPYFSKQNELENEISAYVVALLNIYVILFALSTLMALFISNLVTRPLRTISQNMSDISLGRKNDGLKWEAVDEIGNLVNAYNKMLMELELSANKLAKSERESAWREMAKQVAHEIKNPLTPMKLSLQHLQRVIETNPEDLKERVTKLSSMLVEQIDSLSHIASEFSAFAKMPIPVLEKVNIAAVAETTVNLFSHDKNIEFSFTSKNPELQWILADKEQCQRVFSNLIKNAVQAISEHQVGKISVHSEVNLHSKTVVFKIIDNGSGIPADAIEKIFMPNFSTKSEGMGLGLAMVKNIVDSFGGAIQFTTKENIGTTFTLSFPIISGE